MIDPLTGVVIERHEELVVYPAKHFVLPEERIDGAVEAIQEELEERLEQLKQSWEAAGGAEAVSADAVRHRDAAGGGVLPGDRELQPASCGAEAGRAPYTLLDFFPPDSLLFIDESHVTIPQVRGMFAGDFSRKSTLVEHGFRLPSALDNRPLAV